MSYTKHDFKSGDILYASDMAEMDNQIVLHDNKIGEVVFEENLTDAFKFVTGWLSKSGAVIGTSGMSTDFIPVEEGDVFIWSGSVDMGGSYGVCEYDAAKNFIKGDTLATESYKLARNVRYTVTEGAYVRFSTFATMPHESALIRTKEYDGITELKNKTEEYLADALQGYVERGNGSYSEYSDAIVTQFIPAKEADVFLVSCRSQYNVCGACFYDTSRQFIKSAVFEAGGNSQIFTREKVVAPARTAFVRFSSIYYQYHPLKVWKYEQLPLVHADYQLYEYVRKSNCLFGKKYVACGDSFTAGDFAEKNEETWDERNQAYKTYCWHIADRNNMTLVNDGRSGTTMHNNGDPGAFSVTRYTQVPKDADYITICFGLNETTAPIGTLEDTTNETVMGAWNVVLEYLITNMPYAKIGIIIPDSWCSAAMREALIDVAEYWGIPYLDTTGDPKVPLLIGGKRGGATISTKARELRNAAFQVSAEDSHPNAKGHLYRSTIIENFMRSL